MDNEEPPSLVDVDEAPKQAEVVDTTAMQLEDLSLTKVPLTLVTGKPPYTMAGMAKTLGVRTNRNLQATWALGKQRWSIAS